MRGDQRPIILGVSIALPIISILAVLLRFESRRVKRVQLGADDWTILAALLLTIGVTLDVLLDSRLGDLGWHTRFTADGAPVDDSTFRYFGKATYALEVLVWPCVGMTKISVLLFYKRIFIGRGFQNTVWYFIGISIAWTVAFTFSLIFSCLPIATKWNPNIEGHCVDHISLFTVALATDVILDGLILILPIYNVWKLQMRTRHKVAVIGLFLLGGFTTITGIIRLHFLSFAYVSLKDPLFNDIAYNYAPAFYWSTIETNAGVVSACMPTLRPLFEAYPPTSIFSEITKKFSSGFRFAVPSSTNIRLNSMEHGLTKAESEAFGGHRNKHYAVYDGSISVH